MHSNQLVSTQFRCIEDKRTDWDLADDDSNHNNNSVNNEGAEVPGQVTTASKIGDLMTFPPPASESGFFGSTPASSAPINAATAGERGSKDNAHFLVCRGSRRDRYRY